MVRLHEILPPERVIFLSNKTKDKVLREVVRVIAGPEESRRFMDCFDAVIDRENVLATGLGMGFALPHGKLESESAFSVALGISHEGIDDYGSLDDESVHLVMCIIGPADRQNEYIRLLAQITKFLKNEHDKLLGCTTSEEVIDVVEGY
jgi:mannitol/fructose-specific phosphotransferase system IIA component (Ntr-type)